MIKMGWFNVAFSFFQLLGDLSEVILDFNVVSSIRVFGLFLNSGGSKILERAEVKVLLTY